LLKEIDRIGLDRRQPKETAPERLPINHAEPTVFAHGCVCRGYAATNIYSTGKRVAVIRPDAEYRPFRECEAPRRASCSYRAATMSKYAASRRYRNCPAYAVDSGKGCIDLLAAIVLHPDL
jgi:hypothetical protein